MDPYSASEADEAFANLHGVRQVSLYFVKHVLAPTPQKHRARLGFLALFEEGKVSEKTRETTPAVTQPGTNIHFPVATKQTRRRKDSPTRAAQDSSVERSGPKRCRRCSGGALLRLQTDL